jgi:putative endonuclease
MRHRYFVYILTNDRHTVLYTGVTNDLLRRVGEHRTKTYRGFTSRYNVAKLAHEKQIKAGSRRRKAALINNMNPEWRDLFGDLV